MSQPESMYLSVIRIWAALAWADGVISEAEAVAMKKLIASARLDDDERETALGWLESRVELETAGIAELNREARRGVYRAAAQLAAVDLEVAGDELAFLDRLREGLGIGPEDARAIVAGMPGFGGE